MSWHYQGEIRIKKLESQPFGTNCYIVVCPQSGEGVIVDTPGHSPGSLCLLTGRHLFSGDTLFPGGPGKTGTPAAFEQIVNSITQKLFVLPDETLVYPGHGEDTILGKEKQEFAVFSSRPRTPGLCGDVLWLSS